MKHSGSRPEGLLMGDMAESTIACQQEGCAWEIEDFLPTGVPVLIHPLLAAYATHHTLQAHREFLEELLRDDEDETTVEEMEFEVLSTFEAFGIDPQDPYEHLELVWE